MKHLLLPIALLLLFTETKAQLTAHAGVDFGYCANSNAGPWFGFSVATGGTPPYTYAWSPASALVDSTVEHPTPTATTTTTYTVVVTDNLGATATDTIVVTIYPVPIVSYVASDTSTCAGQPVTFTSTVTSGTPPYTYDWMFGDGSTDNAANTAHAYGAQGLYQPELDVTDSNGCWTYYSEFISVSQMSAVALLTPIICAGANDGSMLAAVTGGIQPYFFMWSNGATTQVINNLSAGTYTVTVGDANGCLVTASNTLTEPTPLVVNTVVTNESSAGACDGAIVTTVTGGYVPYTYAWSNASTVQSPTGLCAGAYSLTVTDNNTCTAGGTGVVGSGSCTNNTLVVSIASQDLSCTHPVDTMDVTVTGGTSPYTFLWSNGVSGLQNIVDVAGVYTVWVTDNNGCVKSATDTILNSGLVVSLAYTNATTCNGNPIGGAKINVSGGTPPYAFLWSNGATADSIANVVSDTYTVTVTDAATCTALYSVFVGQTSTNWSYYVYINVTNGNCGNNGSATATVNGGTSPYTYLWSNGATTQTATGLASGYYTVTVTGADGCTRTGIANIINYCNNVITGNVFSDANNNCLKDLGEIAVGNLYVSATNQQGYTAYGSVNANGTYIILVSSSGNYTVTLASNSWTNSCSNINVCGAQTASFASAGDTVTLNFGVSASSGYDLALHPGWTSANPGFQKNYWVLYHQLSSPTYTGPAVITFKYDSILVFNSCNNSGIHNATAHTITWNVASVPYPYWDWNTVPRAYFTVPANTPIGYQLKQEFWITPTANDCDSTNNHFLFTQPVTGSMDPNEKEVSPAGDIQEEDSVLTYTIHFQNTGNDTTWFITVVDTLSPNLNAATVQTIASSHPYTEFKVSGEGILSWLFNPIFLVDSATNEPASKGFVTFRVKKKNGLALNTEIKNKASIYFDYNEPIVTNTVSSKLTDPNSIFNYNSDATVKVTAAPNPFILSTQITVEGIAGAYDFQLIDVSGKLIKKISGLSESRFVIQRENLSRGVYFYSLTTDAKQKVFGKLVVQ